MRRLRALVTCFEAYGCFPVNASELACRRLQQRGLPAGVEVQWRTYPVDFAAAPQMLREDLQDAPDIVLLTGQAPASAAIRLERTGRNHRSGPNDDAPRALLAGEPPLLRSSLPVELWAAELVRRGLPTQVSDDAGDYLCNAVLYSALHFGHQRRSAPPATFVHLPLAPSQSTELPTLDSRRAADALGHLLDFASRAAT